MPITIVTPLPNAPVGFGFPYQVQTSLIGPLPTSVVWRLTLTSSDEVHNYWNQQYVDRGHQSIGVIGQRDDFSWQVRAAESGFTQGQSVRLLVELVDTANNQVLESLSQAQTVDQISGQPYITTHQPVSTGSGLTEQEHTAVLETNELSLAINAATTAVMSLGGQLVNLPIGQVLSSHLIDFLSDRSLSGGITCDPVRYDASLNALYGVAVHVTSFPDDWQFRTPDGQWGFHDLAVLQIWRGQNLIARHGIHTTSHTLMPLPGLPFPWLTNLSAPLQPPDYHIYVDWAEGVCGELVGLALP